MESDRKQILAKRRLCFNCATGNNKALECTSKSTCRKCGKRHHTSICDQGITNPAGKLPNRDITLTTGQSNEGIFPIVVAEISGAGSACVSAELIERLGVKPLEVQTRIIYLLMASKVAKLEMYELEFQLIDHPHCKSDEGSQNRTFDNRESKP